VLTLASASVAAAAAIERDQAFFMAASAGRVKSGVKSG
jgi:hypothetical protein